MTLSKLPVPDNNGESRLIDRMNVTDLQTVFKQIKDFQKMVQHHLQQDLDYGIIPGTKKPTLLKPGAEKICMLMGLRSSFEVVESTRDFDKGFFQYMIKCKLHHGDIVRTEGLGACNTREKQYIHSDGYSVDNTVLKIAKKRSLVDAALMVSSLSDIFTQDLEDMDITGKNINEQTYATDQDGTISKAQAKRAFALSKGDAEIVRSVISKYGYERSDEIKKTEYEKICKEIEEKAHG